jgi:hypothetical protein
LNKNWKNQFKGEIEEEKLPNANIRYSAHKQQLRRGKSDFRRGGWR